MILCRLIIRPTVPAVFIVNPFHRSLSLIFSEHNADGLQGFLFHSPYMLGAVMQTVGDALLVLAADISLHDDSLLDFR